MRRHPSQVGNAYPQVNWSLTDCSASMGAVMLGMMAGLEARVCIEIGIRSGFTTQVLAYGLEALGGGILVSCDISTESCDYSRQAALKAPNVQHRAICADSATVDWRRELNSMGASDACLALVDGMHTYEACRADLAAIQKVIRPNGLVVVHDYMKDHEGVWRSVREFREWEGWNFLAFPTHYNDNGTGGNAFAVLQRPGPMSVMEK